MSEPACNDRPCLENMEWDEVWWEQTGNQTGKRISYIGDSISCGTRRLITSLSQSSVLCDGFASSKAADNPYLIPSIQLFLQQQSKCDAILFNNGLHGKHLSAEAYAQHMEKLLRFLMETGKPVYVLLSTDDIAHPTRAAMIQPRNQAVLQLAQKYQLPVIDLYTIAVENPQFHAPDGVHFTQEGYEALAKCILDAIC